MGGRVNPRNLSGSIRPWRCGRREDSPLKRHTPPPFFRDMFVFSGRQTKKNKILSCLSTVSFIFISFHPPPHPRDVCNRSCVRPKWKQNFAAFILPPPPIFLIFRVQNNKHPSYLNALHFGYLIISVSMQTSSFSKYFHSKFDTPALQELNCVRK